jgi:hypothetical protein
MAAELGVQGFLLLFHSAAEPQPKHFGKRSSVSVQLQPLISFCNLPT